MAGGTTSGAADAAARFDAAHRALRADPSVQFDIRAAAPPPETPDWLKALGRFLGKLLRPIGRFFRWLASLMPDAPYARILLWTVLALLALALATMVYLRVREGAWRLPRLSGRRAVQGEAEEEDGWTLPEAPARAWLAEADALAAAGRYAEAVHHLLLRSLEDIARRRPRLIQPSLTSRDLGRADAIPSGPRALFARIAALVERSLFGGRAVAADEWADARAAYAEFVRPQGWNARA